MKYFFSEKHNRVTLISLNQKKLGGNLWNVICDCGTQFVCSANDVRSGHTKSCGCLKVEMAALKQLKHGKTETKEYRIWSHARGRCNNPTDAKYHRYGGRGIKMCTKWDNFENFLADMGLCPDGCSIDRIDNDGNYEPNNCRWADSKTQSYNSTVPKFVKLFGEKISASEAGRRLGIHVTSIHQRQRDCNETHQQACDHFVFKKSIKTLKNCKTIVKLAMDRIAA